MSVIGGMIRYVLWILSGKDTLVALIYTKLLGWCVPVLMPVAEINVPE